MRQGLSWLLVCLLGGCAAEPSTQIRSQCEIASPPLQAADAAAPTTQVAETASLAAPVQIERGQPNRFLDGSGRILGVPRRLLFWNRRVDNHQVSARTEQIVADYLWVNNLPDVLVRVNQYAPLAEWKRLAANRRIAPGWRFTVGTLDLLLYTLMPGRLFGDDWYNPFTGTINLYSDVPSIALHEAAYAKDVHHRHYPGTYVTIQHLPVVGMWYRTNATADILQYLKQRGGSAGEIQEANQILYPMYAGAAGGQIGQFIPIPFAAEALNLVGTGVGHIVGRYQAHQVRTKEQQVKPQEREDVSGTILPTTATTEPK